MMTPQQPNRALDAQIAERVMGWRRMPCCNGCVDPNGEWLFRIDPFEEALFKACPHYSTSPADSRLVLERMRELGWGVEIKAFSTGKWAVIFGKDGRICATHESLDMAICLSALAAVGQGDQPNPKTP